MLAPEPAAPIIVAAEFGATDFAWLDDLRRTHFPPERNLIAAHLTLFHHLSPGLLGELGTRLRRATRGVSRPDAWIVEPMSLGRGVALRVRSEVLAVIRADLAAAFHGMLTPQDQAGWRPHVTIQNKVEPAIARRLHAALSGDPGVARPLAITGISTYHYRGGPWEPIARYRFAG